MKQLLHKTITLALLLVLGAGQAFAPSMEMVTYYPSLGESGGGGGEAPVLENGRLHADSLTVGPGFAPPEDGTVADEDMDTGELFVETTLSVGTSNPAAMLHVEGGSLIAGGSGDLNNDGTLSAGDSLGIRRYLEGLFDLSAEEHARADVNGDRAVTGLDAALIQRQLDSGAAAQPVTWQTLPTASLGREVIDKAVRVVYDLDDDEVFVGIGLGDQDPVERLELGGDLTLPESTADGGVIYGINQRGSQPRLHNLGDANTVFGHSNLSFTGSDNSIIGTTLSLTTGSGNTAVRGLINNTAGSNNTVVGSGLGRSETGSNNTMAGFGLMRNNSGINNTALGFGALEEPRRASGSNSNNTAVGKNTLKGIDDGGSENTGVGNSALLSNEDGNSNTAIGHVTIVNTKDKSFNTAIGDSTMATSRDWASSTAIGNLALAGAFSGSVGQGNTAVGDRSLRSLGGGEENTAVGSFSGYRLSESSGNTLVGGQVLYTFDDARNNDEADHNTVFGNDAFKDGDGDENVIVGTQTLEKEDNEGSRNVYLGHRLDLDPSILVLDRLLIGHETLAPEPEGLIDGHFNQETVRTYSHVGIGKAPSTAYRLDINGDARAASWPAASDLRLKQNVIPLSGVLGKINSLRVVSYDWNNLYYAIGRSPQSRQLGLIAQDLEIVFPELVGDWGESGYRSVNYRQLIPVVLQAVVELQAEQEQLLKEIEALEALLEKREKVVL